jgi:hypothetical protein
MRGIRRSGRQNPQASERRYAFSSILERGAVEGPDAELPPAGATPLAGAFAAAFAGCGFGFALRVAGTVAAEGFADGMAEVDIM